MKTFLKYFFGFHFVSMIGVIVGFLLYNAHSEKNPLSTFLTTPDLYFIGFLLVAALHFCLWIFTDKASSFNIKGRLLNFIGDYFFLVLSTLCTIGSLFLLTTFLI